MGYQEAGRYVCLFICYASDLQTSWEGGALTDKPDPYSSDADSDVLADYVLALIRADTPEPELRANAIENLEDFLKERMVSSSSKCFCFGT